MLGKIKVLGLVLSSLMLVACGADLRDMPASKLTEKQMFEVRGSLTDKELELVRMFEIVRSYDHPDTKGDFSYNEMMKIAKEGLEKEEAAKAARAKKDREMRGQ